MKTIGSPLFKDRRSTISWLRWLLIIALSYLLLFHPGKLTPTWQVSGLILLYMLSNLILIILPDWLFETAWLNMAFVAGDSIIISAALFITGLASTYLLLFYFLIILLTTLGKGSRAVVANGLIMGGLYLIFLLEAQGHNVLENSGLLIQFPFLLLCTVFYAVLVDQGDRKQNLILEQVKAAQYGQDILRSEIKTKEQAIKKVEEVLAEMQYRATHDSLTGIPNRALFMDRLQHAIHMAERDKNRFAVIMMDLDHFKEVNDTMGHQSGDLLLREMAARLREVSRKVDTIARLGGDEFAVLLYGVRDRPATILIAQRILRALEIPIVIAGTTLQVKASLGIALFPDDSGDSNNLMRQVDLAMYAAKHSKSVFSFYNSSMDQHKLDHLVLMGELQHAIDHEELVLHYQPKVDFKTGRIIGVEALVRWQHPNQGLLLPDHFISPAERTGMIKPLTAWVSNSALRQCQDWHARGIELTVSMNFSASSLWDETLPAKMAELLESINVMPAWLELEITESALMEKPLGVIEIITKLNAMGLLASVDDFGSGYASLAYLAKLPVASVKIDKSFVMNMLVNRKDDVIVRSIIDLGHNLGLKVVAEGVDNQQTYDRLVALGCDIGQGYFISRPVPAEALEEWLNIRKGIESTGTIVVHEM